MYKNILVPYDGSEQAQHALAAAVEMAAAKEAVRITVLKVAAPMNFDDSTFRVAARMAGVPDVEAAQLEDMRVNYNNEHRKQVEQQIQDYFDALPDNVDVRIVVENGRPQEVIVEYAHDNACDCIVMGRRGLGAIRAALGSVSSAVLREVDLPVLVVR